MAAELRFRAMGADVHVVVDGPAQLVDLARRRIDDLDGRWSRFRLDSEISRLNRAGGQLTVLSEPTFDLVRRAMEGHRRTNGAFDPTVLGDVIRAGYDDDFDNLGPDRCSPPTSPWRRGASATLLFPVSRAVMLPAGVGFDSGGIGKGLAADLVAAELVHPGAAGACVNVGGDLRVMGTWAGGPSWPLAIDHPDGGPGLARLQVTDGGVATSSTLRRAWTMAGERHHHLIDPATGRPAATDLVSVSVVAATAWEAEVVAKAGILAGAEWCQAVVEGAGGVALAVTASGEVLSSPPFTDVAPDATRAHPLVGMP
ncbi:MAG: FAD:protein FMN transferase [Acidimicrobiales bacterium]